MDLRNHPEFFNWRVAVFSVTYACAWMAIGAAVIWQVIAP